MGEKKFKITLKIDSDFFLEMFVCKCEFYYQIRVYHLNQTTLEFATYINNLQEEYNIGCKTTEVKYSKTAVSWGHNNKHFKRRMRPYSNFQNQGPIELLS